MGFNSEHFTVREAGPGVYALLAGTTGACVSNAAIIDLGDRTVVFDTFMTLPAADDLVAAVQSLTGRGAFLAVTSHWHDDHTGGNQLFEGHPIVSTRRTAELIAEHGTFDQAAYAEEVEGYLASAREQEARAETDEQIARARSARMGAEALFAGKDRFRLTLPDTFIDGRMVVRGSGREVEILTYGGGHTESDVFAYLPAEQIAIMGDLLWVGFHPRTNDGDAAAWADMLDRIGGLAVGTLVPGHGDLGSPDHLTVMADYLRYVERIVSDSDISDSAVPGLPFPPGSESWAGGYRFTDGIAALRTR
jgi:glyoxylase-like metal-dependent hydrolase (beta-lactamase superfamily II)